MQVRAFERYIPLTLFGHRRHEVWTFCPRYIARHVRPVRI